MINVKVIESDALLVTSQTYSYVDFEDLSEDLIEGDTVRFILSENEKNLFEGIFVKEADTTVHEVVSMKIEQMVQGGKVKKRKGRELLKKLDREFFVPDENTNDVESKSPSFQSKKKKSVLTLKKEDRKEKIKTVRSLPTIPLRKIGMVVGIVVSIVLLVVIGTSILGDRTDSNATKKASFETLISNENYDEAAKEYPKKIKKIEEIIVNSKDFEVLEEFNDKYPTAEGTFDLAFNLENWEAVIETDQSTLTKERQVMLAYAYIQLDQLDEADILNKKLTSKKLTDALTAAYKKRAVVFVQEGKFDEAKKINDRMNDKELYEVIQTGKSCQEMIDYYSEKKDKENEATWRNRLENLGKDLIEK